MRPALIIILDTALVKPIKGNKYSLHSEDWRFFNQTVEAIKDYYIKGYKICIISNMPDVREGFTTEKAFYRKLKLILKTLEKDLDIKTNTLLSATYSGVSDFYTLPNPGLLYGLASDNEISLYNSVVIGGSLYDKSVAAKIGTIQYIDVTDLAYAL